MKTFVSLSKWIYTLIILPSVLLIAAWQGTRWWHWAISPVAATSEIPPVDQSIQIDVPGGTSTRQIGEDLAAAGLIKSTAAWNIWASWVMLQEKNGSFKQGTYILSPKDDMRAIAQTIWTGDVVARQFTIPEGWSFQDMAARFEQKGYFSKEEFVQAVTQIDREKYDWLPADIKNLEGFLYPDTYQLPSKNVTPQEIIDMMLSRFATVALPIYEQNKDKTNLSLKEWVTLGSIVEKESVIPEERRIIAGVFTNRLNKNMKLETDPTVEYAFGIKQTADQPLTYKQVEQPHPYNTYVNPGLPPGPIASPGKASLEATLQPDQTEYLYFVAKYDGTHVFSTTLEAHEAARDRIRAEREQQQAKQNQGETGEN